MHRFPRDAFPGRSGHTVFPGISSGGSILSSGFPFFFFLAFSPHALLQPEYFRQTGKSPGTACSPLRAPCAQGSGTFCAAGYRFPSGGQQPLPVHSVPWYRKPGIQYAYRSPSVMCPPDYPFRQAVPDGLTGKYFQAEKILLLG